MRRTFFIVIFLLCIISFLLFFLANRFLSSVNIRSELKSKISEEFGLEVNIADAAISFFPGFKVVFEDVDFKNPPNYKNKNFLEINKLLIELKLFPLLLKRIEVKNIEVDTVSCFVELSDEKSNLKEIFLKTDFVKKKARFNSNNFRYDSIIKKDTGGKRNDAVSEKDKLKFNIESLRIGKLKAAFTSGNIHYDFEIDRIKVKDIGIGNKSKFYAEVPNKTGGENLVFKGNFFLSDKPENSNLNLYIVTAGYPLKGLLPRKFKYNGISGISADLDADLYLNCKFTNGDLNLQGGFSFKDTSFLLDGKRYALPDTDITFAAGLNRTGILTLSEFNVKNLYGILNLDGEYTVSSNSFNIHYSISDMDILSIYKLFPEESYVDLSGVVQGKIALEGTLLKDEGAYPNIGVKADLSELSWKYKDLFVKKKGDDASINLNFSYGVNNLLRGTMDLVFADSVVKCDVKEFDVLTLNSEVSFISNKIPLKTLAGHFLDTPYSRYVKGGYMKIVVNWKGPLNNLAEANCNIGVILDNASFSVSGYNFEDLFLDVTFAGKRVDLEKALFNVNNQKVQLGGYCSFHDEKPYVSFFCKGDNIDIDYFNEMFNKIIADFRHKRNKKTCFSNVLSNDRGKRRDVVITSASEYRKKNEMKPEGGNKIEIPLYGEVKCEFNNLYFLNGRCKLNSLKADIITDEGAGLNIALNAKLYDGDLTGILHSSFDEYVSYKAKIFSNGIDMSEFFSGFDNNILSGNLLSELTLSGSAYSVSDLKFNTVGDGYFMLSGGVIGNFSLLSVINKATSLIGIKDKIGVRVPYDKIYCSFYLNEGFLTTEQLFMKSPVLDVAGRVKLGIDRSLDGKLNFLISPSIMRKNAVLDNYLKIPLSLSGTLTEPKYDVGAVTRIIKDFMRNGVEKVLSINDSLSLSGTQDVINAVSGIISDDGDKLFKAIFGNSKR